MYWTEHRLPGSAWREAGAQAVFLVQKTTQERSGLSAIEEGSHPQLIDNEVVLWQKLDYFHYNPVNRGYVDLTEHWRCSSARNYAGQHGLIPVFMDW